MVDGCMDKRNTRPIFQEEREYAAFSSTKRGRARSNSDSLMPSNTSSTPLFSNNDPIYKKDVGLGNRITALNAQQELLGENHSDVLFSLQRLAGVHYRRGEYDHAHRILEEHKSRLQRRNRNGGGKDGSVNIPSEISIPF
mmetsp:Transcript_15682/g.23757  ORF Transcript_15682/g.23757 Transcript_15682/m.23757 type:complete len:140 (-) Transcript_15682:255-674(-)